MSKSADDTVLMRCGNSGSDGLRFGTSTSGAADVLTMIDLLSGTQGSQALSAITGTIALSESDIITQALGTDLGNTPEPNATFVGLSVHRNMARWTWSGGPDYGPFQIYDNETPSGGDVYTLCGTYDGTNGYGRNQNTEVQYLWNAHLSDVGIFGHAMSATEMDEIFASRAVW